MSAARRIAFALAVLAFGPVAAVAEMERPPAVAGRFYPYDRGPILTEVDHFLAVAKPPAVKGQIVALLVPHAGIEFSGEAAATAYNAVDPRDVETIVMVGTAHYMAVDGAAVFPGVYATPVGSLAYDAKFAQRLSKESPRIQALPEAHDREHSIEVNVPFLVRRFPKAKLVALVMNAEDLATAVEVGEAIARAAVGKKVLIVASSDLSHYPPGHVADKVDRTTLHALDSVDPAFFYSVNRFWMARELPGLKCTYCGEGAVTAVTAAARALGARRAQLLRRYNSGDAISEKIYREVVGYAAVAFVKEEGAAPRSPYGLTEDDRRELLREARLSLEGALTGQPPKPIELSTSPAFNLPAAVFVTLDIPGPDGKKQLRGCMGSTEPRETLLEAVRHMAVEAGLNDARFQQLTTAELPSVRIEVSLLSPRTAVRTPAEISPALHGVTLELEGRLGIFLPDVWQTLAVKDDFLAELCSQKAGLPRDCASNPKARLSVFTTQSFEEP